MGSPHNLVFTWNGRYVLLEKKTDIETSSKNVCDFFGLSTSVELSFIARIAPTIKAEVHPSAWPGLSANTIIEVGIKPGARIFPKPPAVLSKISESKDLESVEEEAISPKSHQQELSIKMPKQLQNSTIGPLKTSKPIANPSGILISEIEKEINDVKRFNFEEDNLFEKIQTSPDNIDSHNLERRLSVEAPIFRQPSLKNAPKIATVKALDYDTSQKESQANQQESRTERIEIAAQEDPSPKEKSNGTSERIPHVQATALDSSKEHQTAVETLIPPEKISTPEEVSNKTEEDQQKLITEKTDSIAKETPLLSEKTINTSEMIQPVRATVLNHSKNKNMGDVTPALLNDSTIPINSDESKTDSVDKYDSSSTASDSSAEQINFIGAQSRIPEKENLSNERGSFRESESIPLTFKTPPKSFERLLTESSLPGLSQKEEGVGVAVFSENEELKAEPELIQNNDEKIVKVSDAQEASVEALGKTTDPSSVKRTKKKKILLKLYYEGQTEDQISVNIDIGRKMSEILAYASKKLNISSNLMQLYLQPRDPSETTERLLSLELSAKEAGLINEDVLRIGQVKKDPAPASEVVAKDTADTKKFTPESKFTSKRRSEYDSQRASNIQSVILPTRSSSFLARARPITKPAAVRNTVSTEVKRKKGLPLPSAPNEKLKPNKTSNSETSNSEISNSEAFDMVDPNQKI